MFRDYKLMFFYIKTIQDNLKIINQYFIDNKTKFSYSIKEIQIDRAYRLYTVLNFPKKTTENIQKYGHMYMDQETQKFLNEINNLLCEIGLRELFAMTRADQVDKDSIHIVIEFNKIAIPKFFKKIIYTILGLLVSIITSLFIFF